MGAGMTLSSEEKSPMSFDYFAEMLRAFSLLVLRRGVLAGAASGLSAVPHTAPDITAADTKRKPQQHQDPTSPSPPLVGPDRIGNKEQQR
jgi:hypothetical protein